MSADTQRVDANGSRLRPVLVYACMLILASCGNSNTEPPPVLSTLVVTLSAASLQSGQSGSASVAGLDQHGAPISLGAVAWTSSVPSVATISAAGSISALSPGTTSISASAGNRLGAASLTVLSVPVASLSIAPTTATIAVGDQSTFVATVMGANGMILTDRAVSWTSSDASRAEVSDNGVVTGLAIGTATVFATSEGHSSSVPVTLTAPPFTSLIAGSEHTCGLSRSGAMLCWGWVNAGAMGISSGYAGPAPLPTTVIGKLAFRSGYSSSQTICGLLAAGTAYCWGTAIPTLGTTRSPTVAAAGMSFASLAVADDHACGLTDSGQTYCWGANDSGQLGNGTVSGASSVPVAVRGGLAFNQLATGLGFTCGLTAAGTAYCWGLNIDGAVGDGTTTDRTSPTPVIGGLVFTQLVASGAVCGITRNGALYCWGNNWSGALGNGTTMSPRYPVAVKGGLSFTAVSVGDHTCGITTGGAMYCWGANDYGELGDGTTTRISRTTPTPVGGGLTFTHVAVGGHHTCAIAASGQTYCWGMNGAGQLGDGTTTWHFLPTPIAH